MLKHFSQLRRWYAYATTRPTFFLTLLPLALGVAYALIPPYAPTLISDSPSYLYFHPSRPVGYPLFLNLLRVVWGTFAVVRFTQIFIFSLAVAVLGLAFYRYRQTFAAALALELIILAYPAPMFLANQIMADSLSAAAATFLAAAIIYFFTASTMKNLFLIGIVAAISITLRPVNVAFWLPLPLLALFFFHRLNASVFHVAILVVLSGAGGLAASPLLNVLLHPGIPTTTPLARSFFQKALFLSTPPPEMPQHCDAPFIFQEARQAATYLDTSPPEIAELVRGRYSGYLRFQVIIPKLLHRHGLASMQQADPILWCYTIHRLTHEPTILLSETWREYWKLIFNHTFITAQQRAVFLSYLADHPPPMPDPAPKPEEEYRLRQAAIADVGNATASPEGFEHTEKSFDPPAARPAVLIWMLKAVQTTAIFISFAGLAALTLLCLRRSISQDWQLIGSIAAALQGVLLITALTEIAMPRYILPLWPLMIVMLTLAFCSAYDAAKRVLSTPLRRQP